MPRELRQLKTLSEARRLLEAALPEHVREGRFGGQSVAIAQAVGLILAEDVISPADLPPFDRSIMDGFAVRAEDTFGASEGLPAYLQIAGEVRMGEEPGFSLGFQQCAPIPTGGMLPEGADAVVMVEHTQPWGEDSIEVLHPVASGENVVRRGDDVRSGDVVLAEGHRLRPQDVSALAGLGREAVVVRRARVAVLSTGSELVSHAESPSPGRIRDMNGPALQAAARACGAEPIDLGLLPDHTEQITAALRRGLHEADVVLVSGGTSVGVEDVLHEIIDSLGEPGVVVHGLAVKPGKPVIIGVCAGIPIFGLPGHPTSCLIIFNELVAPLLRRAREQSSPPELPNKAQFTRNFRSQAGREEFVPVRLARAGEEWTATPILGPSALVSTLVQADGVVRIPAAAEGVYAGDEVEVEPFR